MSYFIYDGKKCNSMEAFVNKLSVYSSPSEIKGIFIII